MVGRGVILIDVNTEYQMNTNNNKNLFNFFLNFVWRTFGSAPKCVDDGNIEAIHH